MQTGENSRPWWSFGRWIDAGLDKLDKLGEPLRKKLALDWAKTNRPEPGAYRVHGVHIVVNASGEGEVIDC